MQLSSSDLVMAGSDTETLAELRSATKAELEQGTVTRVIAGKLFDPYSLSLIPNQTITVSSESGLVVDVRAFKESHLDLSGASEVREILDLRHLTVLPGFVDTHVHFFLHAYSETSWDDQLTKESLAERTIRATTHARQTLLAGFTSVRDLGTEGAGDADLALRKCISGPSPLVPGPRYFTANRAIVATGAYGPKGNLYPNREGIDGVTGAEVADGVDECRKAVRKQIGAGADWIKIYADYRFRSRVAQTAPGSAGSQNTFDDDELKEMIHAAHRYGVKAAAHSTNYATMSKLVSFGVDTIEHGHDVVTGLTENVDIRDALKGLFVRPSKTIWVPTLSVYYTMDGPDGPVWRNLERAFRAAIQINDIQIACGGDTGAFTHGDNALEMKLMVRLGANWRKVLSWGTLGGWKCIRSMKWDGKDGEARLLNVGDMGEDVRVVGDNEVPFGAIRKGWAADIVATGVDLENDFEKAVDKKNIVFVMKGGRVIKREGKEVP